MTAVDTQITSDLVEAYSKCRRKAFLLLHGADQQEHHDYCRMVADRAAVSRRNYQAEVNEHEQDFLPRTGPRFRLVAKDGLSHGDLRAACDVVSHAVRPGVAAANEPHLAIGTCNAGPGEKLRLAFTGYVIGKMDQQRPRHGVIVPYGGRPRRIALAGLYPAVEAIVKALREWETLSLSDVPALVLNQHCQTCPFHTACLREAKQHDNLTLLERMTAKAVEKYRKRGILTVSQLSYAYRPRRHRKKHAASLHSFSLELQALAIRTERIYLHEPPSIPKGNVQLFIDIEGLPDQHTDYLIGVDVLEESRMTQHSFWANSPTEEAGIFKECLALAAKYPDAPIFHYGSYEPRAFSRVAKQYGMELDGFLKRLVNVNSAIFGKVYFPARSNRLKDLGQLVGATWDEPDASGLHSIAWRWRWEDQHRQADKDRLTAYNRSDLQALRLLTAELQSIQEAAHTRTDVDFADAPKDNVTPVGEEIRLAFGRILKSAHYAYSHKRIQIRPSKSATNTGTSAPIVVPRVSPIKKRDLASKRGTIVSVPCKRKCPRCPTRRLTPTDTFAVHTLIDLKFSKEGCRKTFVRYTGKRALCPQCERYYFPPTIRRLRGRIFGHAFQAWAVHQHVALRLPYSAISQAAEDLFSETLSKASITGFVRQFAEEYGRTERLLEKWILDSLFVHVDETRINVKGVDEYVWVLTNGNEVMFRRTQTRDSAFIRNLLNGYGGTLISDFYAGYDAVKCRQQKCLVHLIRDLNDDLWKNPFNQEYELFVVAVRDLLGPIFADIDRYGMRKRHLHKHMATVDRFYKTHVDPGSFESDIVGRYLKRFNHYRGSLFTFLDQDGLPWNNNTAERAIRHQEKEPTIISGFWASHRHAGFKASPS
jgi:predicted RecB family nuclease